MIRFILKRRTKEEHSGLEEEHFETLEIDVPELEKRIENSGRGLLGYDIILLEGIEIFKKPTEPKPFCPTCLYPKGVPQ